jgi:epsilon-lactone hydrolase
MPEIGSYLRRRSFLAALASLGAARAFGQSNSTAADTPDTTTIDADGTAHITREIPIPKTLSKRGQEYLAKGIAWAPAADSEQAKQLTDLAFRLYPVKMTEQTMAGVPVRVFDPPAVPETRKNKVLLNFHGGGFVSDSGSMLENIPIASLTQTRTVAVLYTLSPAVKFPVAVDQCVGIYRELLKTYKPENIIVFGTSAGAILSGQFLARVKSGKLPMPAAMGFFSGTADMSTNGDSEAFFAVPGLRGAKLPNPDAHARYLGDHPATDPLVSPLLGDLGGYPPTLCMTGTRDLFLSATSNFYRGLRRAGVEAELAVFDAMPHAHWYMIDIPEAKEALEMQAGFFNRIFDRNM